MPKRSFFALSASLGLCVLYFPALAADPAPVVAPDGSAHILTPPTPRAPRIHGPAIYGEPFLYTVPAHGTVLVKIKSAR